MTDHPVETRTIRIKVAEHRNSDLLVAISDDLKGLMVPGRSEEELLNKLPAAISELLEVQGFKVLAVTTEHGEWTPTGRPLKPWTKLEWVPLFISGNSSRLILLRLWACGRRASVVQA